jgi:carbohydrate kinase (thermoresistant glucokinase family)
MGVSGSGKSTVAGALAKNLGWPLAEGDDFHAPANIAKMHAGTPLDDADRMPWLRSIATWIDARRQAGESGIVTCSALKRSYRDLLSGGGPEVLFVYLKGSVELMAHHLAGREGHFMPATLLSSQFETLEEPAADEPVLTVDAERPVAVIVCEIERRLRTVTYPKRPVT